MIETPSNSNTPVLVLILRRCTSPIQFTSFPAPPRQKQAFIHTIGYPLSSTLRRGKM
nr:MAG TPA: hypothetical protein [Caudoviricetes sp.]